MPRGIDYTIKIILNAEDRAGHQIRSVRDALGELQHGLRMTGTIAIAGLGALAGAAAGAGVALGKLAIDAAPLQGIRAAFEGIAQSAGTSADKMLAALQRGSAGMISQRDLMISFNRAAQLVGEDFARKLPDAMQYLRKVSAATGADMNYLLESLVVGIGRLSPMILDNLGIQVDLTEAYEAYAKSIGKSADKLTKQEQQTAMMNAVLEKLRQNTAAMPDVILNASTAWAQLNTAWADFKDRIGVALLPLFDSVVRGLIKVGEAISANLGPILDGIGPILERIGWGINGFLYSLAEGNGLINAIASGLEEAGFEEIAAGIQGVWQWLQNLWAQIQPYVAQVTGWISSHVKLQDVLVALGVAIGMVVIPAISAIVSAIAPVVAAFLAAVAIAALLREAWENNFLGIRDIVNAVLTFLHDLIVNVLTAIQEFWAQHGEQIIAIVQRVWAMVQALFEAFRAAFEGDWYKFGQKLREYWDMAWENLKNVVKAAFDWFKSVDWGEVGRAIINGIANGIRAAVNWLADAARDAARAALEAAKGFLGIHSPSEVFAGVGEEIMRGWAQGIEQNAMLPLGAMRDVARAIGTFFQDARPMEEHRISIPERNWQPRPFNPGGVPIVIQNLTVYTDNPRTLLERLQSYA